MAFTSSVPILNFALARTESLDGLGQALFEQTCMFGCDAAQVGWRRRGRQHQQLGNYREAKPCNAGRHQHVVGIKDIQAKDIEGNMFQRLDVLENCQREEEEEDR